MNDFKILIFIGMISFLIGMAIRVIRDDDLPTSTSRTISKFFLIVAALCFAIAFGWHLYAN